MNKFNYNGCFKRINDKKFKVNEAGNENKLFPVSCDRCGPMPCVGYYKKLELFLCLGCIDEQEDNPEW